MITLQLPQRNKLTINVFIDYEVKKIPLALKYIYPDLNTNQKNIYLKLKLSVTYFLNTSLYI